ncbi:hypothetical protein ACIF6K_26655 [Streptomyces sp. NPDC085942]|uniref:hypothetical protein n=1 Tax=Streptomyces sp. NPDC085942 TaxID=3365743 RepID=UPI0037D10CA4
MTPADAAELLTLAAAFDRRTVGEADARAWAAALNSMPLDDDARAAVARHYAETADWLTPAHVRKHRTKIRAERVETANVYYDGVPGETGAESIARRRALNRAIADGRVAPQTATQGVGLAPSNAPLALTGGPPPDLAKRLSGIGRDVPDDDEPDTPKRTSPLSVVCPQCASRIGQHCKRAGRPHLRPHPARTRVANGEPAVDPNAEQTAKQRRAAAAAYLERLAPEERAQLAAFEPPTRQEQHA